MNPPQQETSVGLAATFGHPGVARSYLHRPPYPDEVFDVLEGLITERPRTVLDIGAGERPGGRAPNLRWIVGAAETAPPRRPVRPGDSGCQPALDELAADA